MTTKKIFLPFSYGSILRLAFFATAVLALVSFLGPCFAQAEEPKVGKKEAGKYFQKETEVQEVSSSRSRGDGLLMLHVGGFSNSTAYQWKDNNKRTGVGRASYGVTYLYDQWGSLDVSIRLDFIEYKVDDERALKLSLLPLWTFPMAESHFPLYFGFGVGPGVFFNQLADESTLSLDYQLIAGARFLDIVENFGAFIEFGLKNHLHVLSDGQFNGTALVAGIAFTF